MLSIDTSRSRSKLRGMCQLIQKLPQFSRSQTGKYHRLLNAYLVSLHVPI